MSGKTGFDSLPVPKTEGDITRDWIVKALNLQPLEGTINVTGNTQAGSGFLSNLCRVTFQTESGEKSILVKLLPDNPEFLGLAMEQGFDIREIQFYSNVSKKLVNILPSLENNFCKYFGSKLPNKNGEEYRSMLLIEDLKPLGYEMLKTESENWRQNIEQIIKFLGQFHATSKVLEEREKTSIKDLFPFCDGTSEEKSEILLQMGIQNVKLMEDLFIKHDCSDDFRQTYKELGLHISSLIYKPFSKARDHPCLIHGDLWHPNIMIKEGSPGPIKIIDWQLLGYRDPTYDLAIFLLTCLPRGEITKSNFDSLIKTYFLEFKNTFETLGAPYKGRDEESFLQFFNTWGIACGFYWVVLSFDVMSDEERLLKIFAVMYDEYKIPQFLMQQL